MGSSSVLTGFLLNVLLLVTMNVFSQSDWKKGTSWIRITSSNTAFPDKARLNGYTYEEKFYDAAAHYNDSSVLMVVPKKLQKHHQIDLVFWFHGWNNNIDSAVAYFQLAEQFVRVKANAVLVLVETTKNAPDSYAGKLEQPDVFTGLVNDILKALKKEKQVSANCRAGTIILAGHSGAYRAIAYILQNGGLAVQEVDLFDALYSQADKFINWLQKDSKNRFIHWYTHHGGGTDEVSVQMMDTLSAMKIPFKYIEEKQVTISLLRAGRILFIDSQREHNDIINKPDNFHLLLKASPLLLLSAK